jgi:hypothetical protein
VRNIALQRYRQDVRSFHSFFDMLHRVWFSALRWEFQCIRLEHYSPAQAKFLHHFTEEKITVKSASKPYRVSASSS